jgi:hypothetical protein
MVWGSLRIINGEEVYEIPEKNCTNQVIKFVYNRPMVSTGANLDVVSLISRSLG